MKCTEISVLRNLIVKFSQAHPLGRSLTGRLQKIPTAILEEHLSTFLCLEDAKDFNKFIGRLFKTLRRACLSRKIYSENFKDLSAEEIAYSIVIDKTGAYNKTHERVLSRNNENSSMLSEERYKAKGKHFRVTYTWITNISIPYKVQEETVRVTECDIDGKLLNGAQDMKAFLLKVLL